MNSGMRPVYGRDDPEVGGAPQALVRAGAELAGTAVMDEMAFSLEGRNAHYGTPRNSAAAGHIPGGSSSGCAVRPVPDTPGGTSLHSG